MNRASVVGSGLLIGTLACSAFAASPSKADMDYCNQKAAEVSKASPVSPSAKPPSTGTPGANPSGGRITDSTQPGVTPSQLGMAPVGESDPAYRQAYLACINERSRG